MSSGTADPSSAPTLGASPRAATVYGAGKLLSSKLGVEWYWNDDVACGIVERYAQISAPLRKSV